MDFDRYRTLAFARRGRILTIRINRPQAMNAVDADLHHDLAHVFDDANGDPDSDVLVLTGEGRAFCAGGDAAWLTAMAESPEAFDAIAPEAKRIVFSLLELEKPILCRLNGPAAGLGATIALMCDVVVAAQSARIGDPHVRMGLVAGDGGAVIWPQAIGYAKAKEYLLTGDLINAKDAEAMGLINHAVPAAELDARVDAFARKIGGGAMKSIKYTKTAINIGLKQLAHSMMDTCMAYEALTNRSQDHLEAINAFSEKRKPKFTGL